MSAPYTFPEVLFLNFATMKNGAILIIDDDSRNVFALNAVLKARGYTMCSATDAASGIRLLEGGAVINVVLMDMMMPDMDGYEAIGRIRAHKKLQSLPVIAITAQAMVGDRERCLAAGADDYLSKPVNIDLLVRLLEQYF